MADTNTAHTTQETGGHGGGFPPFNAETFPSQFLWFVLAFGALYLLMSKVALPRVGGILENRQNKITGDLDSAAAMQKQADEAGKTYEKTLADARTRAQALGQEASAKAAAEADTKRKALESELNARLGAAEAQIAVTKTQAMANVDAIARDAAAAIVQHLTGKSPAADVIERAVAAVKNS